ncbi:hypothetical protein [Streptomyces sp. NBC_00829]|uniref:hypothetical protein n=1 Tax=Streptomyces sp. NBC_00829 TaxID=2903679 RepID=UPI00386A4E54|nr:hypothetical protein OG293_00320 [Streptomyces sp. NBC_00829]WTB19053.1 hypothetical protein OG293_39215 [Streptomyces sp. NBC_00829]
MNRGGRLSQGHLDLREKREREQAGQTEDVDDHVHYVMLGRIVIVDNDPIRHGRAVRVAVEITAQADRTGLRVTRRKGADTRARYAPVLDSTSTSTSTSTSVRSH